MFNNISWQGYWLTMALLITGYYLVIYLLYFRSAFQAWVLRSVNKNYKGTPSSDKTVFQENAIDFQLPPKDSEEQMVYACVDEISAYLEQAKGSKCTKEELLYSFRRMLKKYPELKTSRYKESLSHVIATQCENICSVHLSAEELKGVWLG